MIEEKYKEEYDAWMTKHNNVVDADTTEADFQAMFMIERRSFPNEGRFKDNDCAACGELFQHAVDDRHTTCRICVEAMQSGEKPKFNDAKQVILIRKDLQMPAGKLGAQVAHASMACILQMGEWQDLGGDHRHERFCIDLDREVSNQAAVLDWMTKSFPKITLEVKNESQLKRYYDEAVAAGLPVSWIVDAGRTIFDGVPTPTCVGIGPAPRDQIDAITKRLRVYQ